MNKKIFKYILTSIFLFPYTYGVLADEENFNGRWTLSLQDKARTLVGTLEIE